MMKIKGQNPVVKNSLYKFKQKPVFTMQMLAGKEDLDEHNG